MPTAIPLDRFARAYVECALWSSTEDDGAPLDDRFYVSDFAPEALERAAADCAAFQAASAADLDLFYGEYGYDLEQAGHDFWLTRNGHGAGFWDRGTGDVGERLTEACRPFGECYVYVSDDGRLYFS